MQSSLLIFVYNDFLKQGSPVFSSLTCFCTLHRPIPTCSQFLQKKNFTSSLCSFFAVWQQTHKEVRQHLVLQCKFGTILANCISHPVLTQKIDISDIQQSSHLICRAFIYDLKLSRLSYECKYTQNAILERGCVACLDP